MASINGIQLKSYKDSVDENGNVLFSAKIYLDNKKIGEVLNKGEGDGNRYIFRKPSYKLKFQGRIKKYYDKNPHTFAGNDWFVEELLLLNEVEEMYTEQAKEGRTIVIVLYPFERVFDIHKFDPLEGEEAVFVAEEKQIEEVVKKYNPAFYQVYSSLDDFIINEVL